MDNAKGHGRYEKHIRQDVESGEALVGSGPDFHMPKVSRVELRKPPHLGKIKVYTSLFRFLSSSGMQYTNALFEAQ